jgi:hypothetical protein
VSELCMTGRVALKDDVHINALEGGNGRVAPSKSYNTHLSEKHRVQRYSQEPVALSDLRAFKQKLFV